MNLKHLRYFVATVDEGGVRRASERIHVSQPAMSLAIKKLEAGLGVSLFEREGRGAAPTREGYRLYREARDLLAKTDQIETLFDKGADQARARIRVAAPAMILSYPMAGKLSAFLRAHPHISIDARQMGAAAVESSLLHGQADIGFLGRAAESVELTSAPVLATKLSLFFRRDHPLANKDKISWPDVFAFPLAAPPSSYLLQQWLGKISKRHKCAIHYGVTSESPQLIIQCLRETDMVAVLLEDLAKSTPDLIALPIDRVDKTADPFVRITACYRKDQAVSLASRGLLEALRT